MAGTPPVDLREAVVLDSALRARCEQRLAQIPLPDPFTLQRFCDLLQSQRGRALTIGPMPAQEPGEPSGVWIATESGDYVFVDETVRPLHRQHIVLHELAHIICDHHGAPVMSEHDAAVLLPSLSAEMVSRVLGRTRYTNAEEQEAEMLATLIAQRVQARGQRVDTEVQALRARLRSTLG